MVSAEFGSFVKMDRRTEDNSRLHFARVLVRIPCNMVIPKVIEVSIDGYPCSISILEEFEPVSDKAEMVGEEGDEEESQWSGTPLFRSTRSACAAMHGLDETVGKSLESWGCRMRNSEGFEESLTKECMATNHKSQDKTADNDCLDPCCLMRDPHLVNGGSNLEAVAAIN